MNPQAIPQTLRTQCVHGWLGSLALHGLLLFSVLPFFRVSPLTVPQDPFRWEVALVDSPQTVKEPTPNLHATEPVTSRPREQTSSPARTVQTSRNAAPTAERIVPIEPPTVEPVTPTSQPFIAASAASPQEPSTASLSEESAPVQPQTSDPPQHQKEMPANAPPTESSTVYTAMAAANEPRPASRDVAPPSSSPAEGSNTEAATAPRPDYGWLQQAIFQKLEELKRSSQPFLDQSQPFKVLVKAVVSREGTLLDSTVVKSSGLERIDQEAMALVQRAFPMQFDRTLDRQQIVMRIPITYSRD